MARPSLKATYFVRPDGVAIAKAPPLTPAQRLAVFERDGRVCKGCGVGVLWNKPWNYPFQWNDQDKRVAHVDHVFPRARGGQNHNDNLRLLCDRCNLSKGAD